MTMDYMKLSEDMILNMSHSFAFTVLVLAGAIALIIYFWRVTRREKHDPRVLEFAHAEKMAELQARHTEATLKINRESPKVIENGPQVQKPPRQIDSVRGDNRDRD